MPDVGAPPHPGDRSLGNQSSQEEVMPELIREEEWTRTRPLTMTPLGWGWGWAGTGWRPSSPTPRPLRFVQGHLSVWPCRVRAWDTLLPAWWHPGGFLHTPNMDGLAPHRRTSAASTPAWSS